MASADSCSAYEQERQARIAENQARLEAIVGKVTATSEHTPDARGFSIDVVPECLV